MFRKESVDSKYLEEIADILDVPISVFFPGDSYKQSDYDERIYVENSPGFSYYEDIYKKIEEAQAKGLSELRIKRLEFVKDQLNEIRILEILFGSIEEVEILTDQKNEEAQHNLIKEYFAHRIIPKIRKELFNDIIEKGLINNKFVIEYLDKFTY